MYHQLKSDAGCPPCAMLSPRQPPCTFSAQAMHPSSRYPTRKQHANSNRHRTCGSSQLSAYAIRLIRPHDADRIVRARAATHPGATLTNAKRDAPTSEEKRGKGKRRSKVTDEGTRRTSTYQAHGAGGPPRERRAVLFSLSFSRMLACPALSLAHAIAGRRCSENGQPMWDYACGRAHGMPSSWLGPVRTVRLQ